MSELTKVDIDTLKVGDIVGYCLYPTFGWNNVFRYPIIQSKTVERITPKRTKFVLNGGVELDVRKAKQLVVLDEEAKRQSSVAKTFKKLQHILFEIEKDKRKGTHLIEGKISDEELFEYYKLMRSLHDKYIGGIGGSQCEQ